MKSRFFAGAPVLLLMCFNLFMLFGGGCGGGTRGSGGQLFDGVVSDSDFRALPGVSVTILTTGDSAITASDGPFSIATSTTSDTVEFLLESEQFSGRSATKVVPGNAKRVFVRLVVGQGSSPSIDADIEVTETKPQPTARPSATRTPVVTSPTPAPQRTPGSTPVPAPTQDDDDDDASSGSSGGTGATGDDDDDDSSDDSDDDDDDSEDDNDDDDDRR